MALHIPSYQDVYHVSPLVDAYGWIAGLTIDFGSGLGSISVYVHPDENSANAGLVPIDRNIVAFGDIIDNKDGTLVRYPTLAELMQDVQFAECFEYIKSKLYENLLAHAKFSTASLV